MNFEIVHESEDRLSREVWSFWLITERSHRPGLVLENYRSETRETTRKRNWDVKRYYYRQMVATRMPFSAEKLAYEDVPLPAMVEAELKTKLYEAMLALEIRKEVRG